MPTDKKLQRKTSEGTEENSTPQGVLNQKIKEDVPVYDLASSAVKLEGYNNSFIVLGRDRNSTKASGAGGRGYTQCGAIDLVVGLDSSNGPSNKIRNPNFFTDAARVYITQKGKIDDYFGLSQGSRVGESEWRSGIGMKADQVAIHGSKHVKIVTGKARTRGEEKNSLGGSIEGGGTIDLLAGNSSDESAMSPMKILGMLDKIGSKPIKTLQPAVKGDNMEQLIKDIVKILSDISAQTFANRKAILKVASKTANHFHESNVPFGPTGPSLMLINQLVPTITDCFVKLSEPTLVKWNLSTLEQNYLNPNFATYIKSKNVNLT